MRINKNIKIGDSNISLEHLVGICAAYKIASSITLTKDVTYSGVQIPLDTKIFNYGDTFTLTNGKIYCNKNAVIRVSYNFLVDEATSNYYILLGKNGTYAYVGGCSPKNGLSGCTMSGTDTFEIKAGEYITLQLGSTSTYTDKKIYQNSRVCVEVVHLL